MKTLVVNLFGAPGAGKSTGAAYIFAMLKTQGINAELVTEFAKDKVWEESKAIFQNQAYIFGKQCFRVSRCVGKVDVIVTDSPLPLSIYYNTLTDPEVRMKPSFNQCVIDTFNSYNNLNYYVNRFKEYNPVGRMQTEEESDAISSEIQTILNLYEIPYYSIDGSLEGYQSIVDYVIKLINEEKENNEE